MKEVDADYSEYLGKDYKSKEKKPKVVSTLVSNHSSYIDPILILNRIRPAFTPSLEFKNLPMVGVFCDVIDCIYINRGGSEESKAKALATIRQR